MVRPASNHRLPLRSWLLAACAGVLLLPATAAAYSVDVHRALAERSLRGQIELGNLPVPTEEFVVKFWIWFGQAMAQSSDPAIDGTDPTRFQARYPNPRAFDAFAIRGFLGLRQTPEPQIWGLERFDRNEVIDRFNTVILASAYPDEDRRNQDRFAYDGQRQARKLPDGRPVPADPMSLNMGPAEGMSSQAHAHYELGADQPSADVAVLQAAPWNFVLAPGFPGHVDTYAAEMAQLHLDLAVLAWAWGTDEFNAAGEYLAMVWLGAGLHYVQDVAGPLHTVQVGSYALFEKAQIRHWLEALRTGGGTWADLPGFVAIGMDYLRNHHLFAEQWLAEELDRVRSGKPAHPKLAAAWDALGQDDPELLAALGTQLQPYMSGRFSTQPWDDGEGAGSLLVQTLAKLGAKEGGALYDAALAAGGPRLTELGYVLQEDRPLRPDELGDPADPAVQAAWARMAEIHAKSLRRAATASRLYLEAFKVGNPDAAARRIRRNRLNQLELQEARVAKFVAAPPPAATRNVQAPAWLYGPLAAGVLLFGMGGLGLRAVRRRRRGPGGPATAAVAAATPDAEDGRA